MDHATQEIPINFFADIRPRLKELQGRPLEEAYKGLINIIQNPVLDSIEKRYGEKDVETQCFYHRRPHTELIMNRAEGVLRAFSNISEVAIQRARFVALLHDVINDFKLEQSQKTGREIKKALWKDNENRTIDVVQALLDLPELSAVIPQDEKGKIVTMIKSTEPAFDQGFGFYQPYIGDLPLEQRVVAMVDIGSAGMQPDQFLKDGALLFRERQLWMERILKEKRSLTEDEKHDIRIEILDALEAQVTFAKRFKELHQQDLQALSSPRSQEDASKLSDQDTQTLEIFFQGYHESIKTAENRVNEAKDQNLYKLFTLFYPLETIAHLKDLDVS